MLIEAILFMLIYIPINFSHQKDLEFELESVSALRSQYEEGLRQNEALREHLEREVESVRSSLQNQEKSTTESELVKLSGQLEESERWNRSLQSRLDQMSPRSGGVGGSRDQTDSGSRNSFPAEITVMVEKLQSVSVLVIKISVPIYTVFAKIALSFNGL